jgi:hypothetical protein
MQGSELLPQFAESFAAKRVYSEPLRENGTTIITAAAVRGGGGLGNAAKADGDSGGGIGLSARPVGAYVVRNGRVVWKPAFDFTRLILRGQLVAITGLLVFGLVMRSRARAYAIRGSKA